MTDEYATVPVQELPETWSDERMHVLDETCWCQPAKVMEDRPQGPVYRLIHHKEASPDVPRT